MKIMEALADKAGYKPSEAAVRAELEKQLNSLTPEQKKQVEERMKAAGKTIKSFTEEMAKNKEAQRNQANMKWISEKIAPTVKVTEENALKFYNENKARFVTPETITASHILIQPEKAGDKASEQKAEAKAKAILAQIKQGADFGTLAQTDSACPSGKRAKGSLGKMTKDGLDQEFFKRLDQACESDPTHWNSHLNTEYAIGPGFELDYDNEHVEYYSYRIYPDQTPVDRSRGMCDRMVKGHDGELTKDWDGSFISVKVQKDTIILRDGWLR
jgi:hypothetical protein